MNAGVTAERVYETLRGRILSRAFRPGERLDPALLAEALMSSVTPVRDALHRLTGEGLVDTRIAGGFHLPPLDEPALKDLYDWSTELLLLSIRSWPKQLVAASTLSPSDQRSVAEMTADLFLAIATRSSNGQHARAVDRLNARLHAVRTVERLVIPGGDGDIAALTNAFARDDREALRQLVGAYHRPRRKAAAELVRAVYRID